jgi:hypothetical protein
LGRATPAHYKAIVEITKYLETKGYGLYIKTSWDGKLSQLSDKADSEVCGEKDTSIVYMALYDIFVKLLFPGNLR